VRGTIHTALWYADLGYAVLPCAPGRKVPITEHGLRDATTDAEQVTEWWTQHPEANVAIRTDGLLVIDVDGEGNAWLSDAPDKLADLEAAPLSLTPHAGRQYFFRQPKGRVWRNTAGRLAQRVDTRANGGYVLVAPSIVDGKAYQWADNRELTQSPERLPEPPAWLIELLDGLTTSSGAVGTDTSANAIPEGQRNATLARLAGSMRRHGMSRDEILAAIQVTNQTRCQPPLPDAEVERIATSVARYEPDAVSVALVENHYEQIFGNDGGTDEPAAAPTATDPGPIPERLFQVPGFVTQVMEFTLAKAPYPNLCLAFCGAMALQSFLAGRKVCTPSDLRANIYLLALASSGLGKDFPRKVNSQVLFEIGLINALGDKFASGEGIQDALIRSNAMLFQNDEMDGVLRQINLDRENKRESIPNILLTLYTSANDIYPIRVKAGQKEAVHIDQPHLTLFGTATRECFYESLSQRMLTNGFFARMIIIDAGKRGQGQASGSAREVPESILQTARWWADFQPGSRPANLLAIHPEPRIVPFEPEAAEAMLQLQRMTEAEYERADVSNDEVARTAWSRTCENAQKQALIYACSENHETPVIGLPAVEWATAFAMHQTRRQLYLAQSYVAENPFHAECLKLLRKLKEAGGQLARRQLMRAMRCKAGDFDQIISTLLQQGDIVAVEIQTKTKPAQGYQLA